MTTPIWDWDWKTAFRKAGIVFFVFAVTVGLPLPAMMLSYEVVEQDEYGVVTQPGGEVVRTVGPGDHFIIPVYEKMHRVQNEETVTGTVSALSSDGINIEIDYRSRLMISQAEAGNFYLKYGMENMGDRYSDPCTRASLRTESAKYEWQTLQSEHEVLENATMECEDGSMSITVTDVRLA